MEATFQNPAQTERRRAFRERWAHPRSFAIPKGRGWKVEVINLIAVDLCAEDGVFIAKAPRFGLAPSRPMARQALLALQMHIEWAFLDLSQAPGGQLTQEDKLLLAKLSKHLQLPEGGAEPLTLEDRRTFLAFPDGERQMVLERQARLVSPELQEEDDE